MFRVVQQRISWLGLVEWTFEFTCRAAKPSTGFLRLVQFVIPEIHRVGAILKLVELEQRVRCTSAAIGESNPKPRQNLALLGFVVHVLSDLFFDRLEELLILDPPSF